MKKNLLTLLLLIAVFSSCKKNDSTTPQALDFKVDSSSYLPASIVTLTASNTIARDTATVSIGNYAVFMKKVSDKQYAFLLPVLPEGDYTINLSKIGAMTNASLAVKAYTPIINPMSVISQFSTVNNSKIDSLAKNSYKNAITTADISFMKQIMTKFNQAIQSATDSQKTVIAYYLSQMALQKRDSLPLGRIDTAYGLFNSPHLVIRNNIAVFGGGDFLEEIGQQIAYEGNHIIKAVTKIGVTGVMPIVATGAFAAIPPPDPIRLSIFAASLGNYMNQLVDIKNALKEEESTASIAEKINTNSIPNRICKTGEAFWEKVSGKFRSIIQSDKSNPDLDDAINAEAEMEQDDKLVQSAFEKVKANMGVTQAYTPYTSGITTIAKEKTVDVNEKYVILSKISNPAIKFDAISDGANGLKIIFTNPDKSITIPTPFTYTVTYQQASINNAVSTVESAIFNPTVIKIGDLAFGGVVFYIDSTGMHGLVAAMIAQTTTAAWDPDPLGWTPKAKVVWAGDSAIGRGSLNTDKIISVLGNGGDNAASVCRRYRGGGYSDWFLPSIFELNEMANNSDAIGGMVYNELNNGKGFSFYWSSTEVINYARYADLKYWAFTITSGITGGGTYKRTGLGAAVTKGNTCNVRAVRAF